MQVKWYAIRLSGPVKMFFVFFLLATLIFVYDGCVDRDPEKFYDRNGHIRLSDSGRNATSPSGVYYSSLDPVVSDDGLSDNSNDGQDPVDSSIGTFEPSSDEGDTTGDQTTDNGLKNSRALILIHGTGGSLDDFGEIERYEGFAREIGADLMTFTYESSFMPADVPGAVTLGRRFADFLSFIDYQDILVIAHSFGGLVAREAILQTNENRLPQKVSKLIMFATPSYGTLTKLLYLSLRSNEQLQDVEFGSDYLFSLTERWNSCRENTSGCRLPWVVSLAGDYLLSKVLSREEQRVPFDGAVIAASALLPDSDWFLVDRMHFDLGRIFEDGRSEAIVRAVLDPLCSGDDRRNCKLPERDDEKLGMIAPILFFHYPESWGKLEVVLPEGLTNHSFLPGFITSGSCCASFDSEEPSPFISNYLLDLSIDAGMVEKLDGLELKLDFSDRQCRLPLGSLGQRFSRQRAFWYDFTDQLGCTPVLY